MDIKMMAPDFTVGAAQNLRGIPRNGPGTEPDAKARASAHKVATEFEAMFAGMMLKSMRSSLKPDNLTGGGKGEEIFQSLLDQEYATSIAKQGSLGIAQTVEKLLLEDASRQSAAIARRNSGSKP